VPSFLEESGRAERWARLPALERVEGDRVVLTFDDGPDADATPEVLAALEECGVRATFFLVGEQAIGHRGLAREIADRGHDVALHGFAHRPHDELSPQGARDDLARGLGTIEVATGRRPRFYRPPYGIFSDASYAACGDLGLERVYWSAWGVDWESISAERIAELVIRDLRPGAIVLLHDSPRYGHRPSAVPTARAVPLIAAAAAERGLELVTLSDAVR
jgi:peptidoglycan/xylan/chitin deacetylase (PgdA/CDA1 family)